jgi:MFS family permease
MKITSSKLPVNTPFYYGWIIVFIAALGLFFSGPGQTFSISVFIDYYIHDFGWSRSLVSGLYSLATLIAGLFLFLVGRYIDRFGQRRITVVIALLLAFACIWNSFIAGPIMLFIGFFMLRLFGQGSMSLIPSTLVAQWFVKKRGRALGLMVIGGFLGSAVFPPLNTWMINEWGWPATWRVWSALLLFFFVPLAFFLIRNKPEDVGLAPDNRLDLTTSLADTKPEPVEDDWTLKEAMGTRAFWLILICVAIPAMVNTGLIFHLVSIVGEKGMSNQTSAIVLSLMAIVSFPVTLIAGFINERFKAHHVLSVAFLGQIVAMLVLLAAESVQMAVLFGIIRGVVGGFEAITFGVIWPNYFGRKYIGSIKGVAMTSGVIGSAFGPLPFGIAFDYFGGYLEIIVIMMIFPLIGLIAAIASPAPRKRTATYTNN